MPRRPLEPRPRIALEAEGELASETLVAEAGAYALTLSTNLRDLAVELHSSYVGHLRAATTHVAEVVLKRGEPGAETSARKLRGIEVPVVYARRRCLIDHLERLQEVLAEAGFGTAQMDAATRRCGRSRPREARKERGRPGRAAPPDCRTPSACGRGGDGPAPGGAPAVTDANGVPRSLPLSAIDVEEGFNPRTTSDEEQQAQLVESVRRHGILQPLLVAPAGEGTLPSRSR